MKTILTTLLLCLYISPTFAQGASATPHMKIQDFFNHLNANNVSSLVDEFYAENIDFQDPVVHFNSREQIKKYYLHQYTNLKSIHFDFHDVVTENNTTTATWTMHLEHPAIKGGKAIQVDGISVIKTVDGKVAFHRDYFDMGAFVYEHVPVLGGAIRFIKKKLANP